MISADGKGIVMRPDALRPATAKKARQATTKLATRLSKGEKPNRKRMAEVGGRLRPGSGTPDSRRHHRKPRSAARHRHRTGVPAGGTQGEDQVAHRERGRRRRDRHRLDLRPSPAP